jgi:hypothetical protein
MIATPRPVPVHLVCCHCRKVKPCWWLVAKCGYADGSRPMCSDCYHEPTSSYYRNRFTPITITWPLTPKMLEWAPRLRGEG